MSWCSPVSEMPGERPCVILLLTPPLGADAAEALGRGCEEEGIPLAWDAARPGDTAHSAALRSRLDVGLLAEEGRVSIGVTQIPDGAWMEIEIKGPGDWRWAGQAAARLVKGQPMPPSPAQRTEAQAPVQTASPRPAPSQLPAPDVGLRPVAAPYLEERGAVVEDEFEALVSRVTREIMEKIRGGGEVVG